MTDALFHIIALGVAILGVLRGYRRGLTGMVTSVLGMAFGIVTAHIFADAATDFALEILPHQRGRDMQYVATNLGCGGVFFLVYFIFRSLTWIIRAAMSLAQGGGLINSLLGAFFCLANYLLMLSICYNVFVGIDPSSALMKYGRADDGNICAGVLWIAPTCLGSESFSDFALQEQLREAKKISVNRGAPSGVIKMTDKIELS